MSQRLQQDRGTDQGKPLQGSRKSKFSKCERSAGRKGREGESWRHLPPRLGGRAGRRPCLQGRAWPSETVTRQRKRCLQEPGNPWKDQKMRAGGGLGIFGLQGHLLFTQKPELTVLRKRVCMSTWGALTRGLHRKPLRGPSYPQGTGEDPSSEQGLAQACS